MEGFETYAALFSNPYPLVPQSRDTEARSVASSAPSESLMLSSFDVGDFGDTSAVSPQYAELMEVVSRAVYVLNID